jgi:hypothetical protein
LRSTDQVLVAGTPSAPPPVDRFSYFPSGPAYALHSASGDQYQGQRWWRLCKNGVCRRKRTSSGRPEGVRWFAQRCRWRFSEQGLVSDGEAPQFPEAIIGCQPGDGSFCRIGAEESSAWKMRATQPRHLIWIKAAVAAKFGQPSGYTHTDLNKIILIAFSIFAFLHGEGQTRRPAKGRQGWPYHGGCTSPGRLSSAPLATARA